MPTKYVVRVREEENDSRNEKTWVYLSAEEALELQREAEKNGFFTKILKVQSNAN